MTKKKPTSRKSKSAKLQGKREVAQPKWRIMVQKYRRAPLMWLGLISSFVGIVGFLFLVYPRISVYPGTPLNLHNPFKTPFMIKNDGYLPIFNIKYSLTAEKMELLQNITFENSGGSMGNTVEKLSPNKSSALFIDRVFGMPPDFVKYARVFIQVSYRPFLVPFTFTEKIRFKTEINTNKEYVWFESYEK